MTARFESTARARVSIRVEPSCLTSQFGPGSLDYGHGLVTTDIKINTAKKQKFNAQLPHRNLNVGRKLSDVDTTVRVQKKDAWAHGDSVPLQGGLGMC